MKKIKEVLFIVSSVKNLLELENHNNWKLYKELSLNFNNIYLITPSNERKIYNNNIYNYGIRNKFIGKLPNSIRNIIALFICFYNVSCLYSNCKYSTKVSIVSSEPTFGGLICMFHKLFFKSKYIVEFHGTLLTFPRESFGRIKSKVIRKVSIITSKYATSIRVVSKPILADFKETNISQKKIKLLYPRYDSDTFKRIQIKEKTEKSHINLLFVGRIVSPKGLIYLVKAMKNMNNKFRLKVIGNGTLLKDIKTYCYEKEINSIEFLGSLNAIEINNIMNKSDLLIVPSIDEGLGRIVLEAKATGLPVFSTNVGGLKELYYMGLIDKQFSPKSTKAIIKILKSNIPERYDVSSDKLKLFNFYKNTKEYIKYIKEHSILL